MDDARGDVRWLTYDELAALRGISRESATRLAMRRHWTRRSGNDGKARVAVPVDATSPPDTPPHDIVAVIAPDVARDESRDVRVMTGDTSPRSDDLVDVLRSQVADLIQHRDAADTRAQAVETERGRLFELFLSREGQGTALTARAENAERRADKAEALLAGELAQLRAMVATLSEERTRTAVSPPAPESRRTSRLRRRGLLGLLGL